MIDNYNLFEIHERKQAKTPHLTDCQGIEIYDGEPFWELDGVIYSQQTLDEAKRWFEYDG